MNKVLQWLRSKLYVAEIEFAFNAGTKEIIARKVRRKVFPRPDGWREYGDSVQSISVPRASFMKFAEQMKDAAGFIDRMERIYGRAK